MEKTQKPQPQRIWPAKMLATAALCLAMSFLLSYVKLFSMPLGGSVTLASMLPVMLFAWLHGVRKGLVVGFAYGVLQFLQGPYVLHWVQVLLDYPIPFAMLGLAGAFRRFEGKPWALPAGVLLACAGRFIVHTVGGMIFYTDYTELNLFSGMIASAAYNGGYLGVDAVICLAIVAIPPVQRMIGRLKTL
ncbi:MAG: energy-coupled thiamine transporter ThiT [Oscillospiraceae bacterium]|jgi:thiamine transporter|nr:energy-coupled thiamine transporter ThiT [Oscillospiraceae bacterium]